MIRWLKFNTVGVVGTGVQLLILYLLLKLRMNYLAATALAVEVALLHNYVWHSRWTWREIAGSFLRGSLWRFQLSNGLVSICSNLLLMRLLAGWAGIPALPANLSAIAITSVVNFWLSDKWVFGRYRKGFDYCRGLGAPPPPSPAANRAAVKR